MINLAAGTKVKVRTWDGRIRSDKVLEYENDIKNGRPGYSLASGHWCYAYQIVGVINEGR